jgi:hypothetical protein
MGGEPPAAPRTVSVAAGRLLLVASSIVVAVALARYGYRTLRRPSAPVVYRGAGPCDYSLSFYAETGDVITQARGSFKLVMIPSRSTATIPISERLATRSMPAGFASRRDNPTRESRSPSCSAARRHSGKDCRPMC